MEVELDQPFDVEAMLAAADKVAMQHANGFGRHRTVVCKHWLRGLCKKGDKCDYLHQYDSKRMPVCQFWQRGSCSRPDCQFRHESPQDSAPECPWYKRGFCKQGPFCKFKHMRAEPCVDYFDIAFCLAGPDCKYGHPSFDPRSRVAMPMAAPAEGGGDFGRPERRDFGARRTGPLDVNAEMEIATRSVWLGNIPADVEEQDVYKMVQEQLQGVQTLESVRVNRPKNCCFVNFGDVEEAKLCFRAIHKLGRLKGQQIRVGWAKEQHKTGQDDRSWRPAGSTISMSQITPDLLGPR